MTKECFIIVNKKTEEKRKNQNTLLNKLYRRFFEANKIGSCDFNWTVKGSN